MGVTMNYGILFSTELQKMAREIQFKNMVDDDAQAKQMHHNTMIQNMMSGKGNAGFISSRLPGVNQPMVSGGAGRDLNEASKNLEKAKAMAEKASPGSTFKPAAGRTVANRQ